MTPRQHPDAKTFSKGGVHPDDHKISAAAAIVDLPLPKVVTIPIAQHLGAPARIVVQRGDIVQVGQVIATHEGFVSSNIHASVSGKVGIIEPVMDSSGFKHTAISIRVKGDDWDPAIDRSPDLAEPIKLSSAEIVTRILDAGVVGMGGAAFPSHVKLTLPEGKHVEYLLINGVECEPYLTADHRLMVEKTKEIVVGIKILMKALGATRAIIGIEENKSDAITRFESLVKQEAGISVAALEVHYPQGGEKQLIQALLQREVPSGGLPIDVGVIVHNVGTIFAVYEAVQKNKPLLERVVTVTGDSVKVPSNFRVRIGTPVMDLIQAAGGLPEDTGKVVSGGPMMGKAIADLDVPIAKGTSGILMIRRSESVRAEVYNCVHCGKCIEACPMGLEPYRLLLLAKKGDSNKAQEEHVLDCIECGSCSFVCPSNRPLLDYIRLGKTIIRNKKEVMSNGLLTVSSSPHIHTDLTVPQIMRIVIVAMMPAWIFSIVNFGISAIYVTLLSVAFCMATEYGIARFLLRRATSLYDGSAIITGMLLAFNVPSNLPWYVILIGSIVSIGLGKMTFGGLGNNPFNPALVGRVFLLLSFPVQMTSWPRAGATLSLDAITSATPLGILKDGLRSGDTVPMLMSKMPSYSDFFFGYTGGSMGEMSAFALLLGLSYMMIKKIVTWHIPVSMVATVFAMTGIFWLIDPVHYANPFFHILTGGVMLGAVFMATDYVTSPFTHRGMIVFGVGIGILTVLIRLFGNYPEGVSFAILIMNAFVPLINQFAKQPRYGSTMKVIKPETKS